MARWVCQGESPLPLLLDTIQTQHDLAPHVVWTSLGLRVSALKIQAPAACGVPTSCPRHFSYPCLGDIKGHAQGDHLHWRAGSKVKSSPRGFEGPRRLSKADEARNILANVIVCHVEVDRYNFTQKVVLVHLPCPLIEVPEAMLWRLECPFLSWTWPSFKFFVHSGNIPSLRLVHDSACPSNVLHLRSPFVNGKQAMINSGYTFNGL